MSRQVIVTRHEGTVQWLRQQGIDTDYVITYISEESARGKHIIGNVPIWVAAKADMVSLIYFESKPNFHKYKFLTPEYMDAYGAHLRTFKVEEVEWEGQ